MKSDLEIAQQTKLLPITEIASKTGIKKMNWCLMANTRPR